MKRLFIQVSAFDPKIKINLYQIPVFAFEGLDTGSLGTAFVIGGVVTVARRWRGDCIDEAGRFAAAIASTMA
ncbi:MAG: hypothetical protein ACLVES_06550 [Faecalibacterium prausnitzii]